MPFVAPKSTSSTTNSAGGRTTFRPPWVKDDAATNAKPSVPWAKKTATTKAEKENGEKVAATPTTGGLKKTTPGTKTETAKKAEPLSSVKKTAEPAKKIVEPAKKVAAPAKKTAEPVKKTNEPVKQMTAAQAAAAAKKKEPTPSSSEEEESEEEEETEEEETEEETEEESEEESEEEESEPVKKTGQAALKSVPAKKEAEIVEIPAPPPLPSLAPPPPPPPFGAKPAEKREVSGAKKAVLEKLKTRPRRRPDWSEMMKEVESGRKLKHVVCNDRSQPVLTCKSMTKVDDKFIYETEKDKPHNKLLKQIQGGIRLKPTKTNDRSKPFIEGLRKFRRQMTIEEQLQKSQSKVNMLGEGVKNSAGNSVVDGAGASSCLGTALSIDDASDDELDDIDKIRDDLQSTKQMLALELRNREAQERENKKLIAKIATLEAELEREKSREKNLEYGSNVIVATMDPTPGTEELFVARLKKEGEDAVKSAKDLEKKYHDTGEQLDQAKSEMEEQKRQIQILERKLAQALQGDITPDMQRAAFNFCYTYKDPNDFDTYYARDGIASDLHHYHKGGGSLNGSRRPSDVHTGRDSSPEFDLDLSESDPDEPEEKKTERHERRAGKEVKVLRSKLTKLKVKQEAAKKEKDALKQAMKKNHVILKEENKKFKKLEKEVHKMAASMKMEEDEDGVAEKDDDDEEEEAEEAEAEQSEESDEESEESESEESEAGTESESEAEDATNVDKKQNLEPRVKKHESRLLAMKKCNVLLQANVDNLQEEITQVRSKAVNLQAELDSVLADLGL